MNRRHFLSALAAAVAGSNYDPERALWRPGAKLISIPKPRLTITSWPGIEQSREVLRVGDNFTLHVIYRLGEPTTVVVGGRVDFPLYPA